jgi:hypothetical protein
VAHELLEKRARRMEAAVIANLQRRMKTEEMKGRERVERDRNKAPSLQ